MLEDERVIGTAHVAFGTSAGLAGVNAAGVHIDGVMLQATVEVDGERLLDNGRLVPTPRDRHAALGIAGALAGAARAR